MTDERVKEMWLEGQRNELATLLKGIPVTIAEKMYAQSMRNTDTDVDDIVSWALESMWMTIESWDPDVGVPLRGWVAFKVRRDIIDVQKLMMRQKRGGGHARVPFEILADRGERMGAGPNVDEEDAHCERYDPTANNELAHMMPSVRAVEDAAAAAVDAKTALKHLPEKWRDEWEPILAGLAAGATLREIGEALGRSHEWVRQEAELARAHLRSCLA